MDRIRIALILLPLILFSLPLCAEGSQTDSYQPEWIGWFRAGYDHDFTNGSVNGFNNYSARIIARGRYDSRISYHMMTEMINQSSTDSRPIFLQGWISYKLSEQLSVRVGQYKYPFGKEAYGTVMGWKFANPSYVSSNITKKLGRSGGFYRDAGIQLSAERLVREDFSVFTKLMLMNGSGINSYDTNSEKDFVGQLGIKMKHGLEIGGSYFAGNDEHGDESAVNGYILFKNSGLHAQAEYSRAVYENGPYEDIEPAGFYLFATYEIYPGVETGCRYDRYESNINNEDTDRDRFSLMAAYNFSKLTRIMLNYEIPGGTRNEDADDFLSLNFYLSFD